MSGPAAGLPLPRVSVVIRSCRRLEQMFVLLERCLEQDYPDYEVLILEQSAGERAEFRDRLDQAARHPRVRLFEHGPLGPARARNIATEQARGDVMLFIDDDDLPLTRTWIFDHAKNFVDPFCVAVSGRQVLSEGEDPRQHDTWLNHRLCLRYSFLKMPRARVRHSRRLVGVTQVHGTNASIRRNVILRVGGWDEEKDHEENSFAFRLATAKHRDEYFAYDPLPVVLRGLDLPGGVGRRTATVQYILQAELNYSHRVIRRYYPLRFWAFYPAYLGLALKRGYSHTRRFHPDTPRRNVIEILCSSVLVARRRAWDSRDQPAT